MTIKALEARLSEAQKTANRTAQLSTPVSDPLQGWAYLANVLGSQAGELRAERAAQEGRGQLAALLAGIRDYGDIDATTLAQVGALDPEQQRFLTERMLSIQDREDTQGFTTSERVASEGAREAAAISEDERTIDENKRQEALPQIDQAKIEAAYQAGQLGGPAGSPQAIANRDAALAKANALPKGTSVTVSTGENRSEFDKKSDQMAGERMDSIVRQGQQAPAFMSQIEQLREIGRQVGTGKDADVLAALGPWAEFAGIDIKNLGEMQAFNSIAAAMAPRMRVEGSGTMSNFDAQQLLRSLPQLGNDPLGNEIIANTFKSIADHQVKSAEIASMAQRGEISWQQADQRIAALPYPYEAFKKYMEDSKKAVAAGKAAEAGAGTPVEPDMSDEDYIKHYGGGR